MQNSTPKAPNNSLTHVNEVGVAQWLGCWNNNRKIVCSNPTTGKLLFNVCNHYVNMTHHMYMQTPMLVSKKRTCSIFFRSLMKTC